MEIIRIEKQNCVDAVYSQMKNLIASGKWTEGEKLVSEQKLGDLFGVSRVVIREALQRLRSEKMVITRQGMGSFVSNPRNYEEKEYSTISLPIKISISDKQFEDFVDFRSCIEFRAIEIAAKQASEKDFEKVKSALERMESHLNNIEEFSEDDYLFHKAVVDCANNSFFSMAVISVKEQMIQTFLEMNKLNDSVNWGIEVHRQVYEKLVARDAKGAIALLSKNNQYNKARLGQFIAPGAQTNN